MSGALAGVRVVDLSDQMSGAYAARMFGDYGAEVIMVEPPEGSALRREPPFADDERGENNSLLHAYLNWNKRSAVVDDADLRKLLLSADVVVTTRVHGPGDALADILSEIAGRAVHLSVTPHGLTGPLAGRSGNNLTHCARCGWSNINRLQEEPPLQLPLRQTGYTAGVAAYVAGVAAYYRMAATGQGERVDVSELEAMASTNAPWAIVGIFSGSEYMEFGPTGRRRHGNPGPLWQTRNGPINFGFGDWARWREAMTYLGLEDIGTDERYEPVLGRYQQDLRPVVGALAESVATRDKWDVFNRLAELRCISGVVQNTEELLGSDQLKERSFFVDTEVNGRVARAPGAAVSLSDTPFELQRKAPTLGEFPGDSSSRKLSQNPESATGAPLAGVRILTFTQAWSGTFGTELLAFLGADVVQVEGRRRPDVWRGAGAPIPQGVLNPDIEQSPLNTNGMFNSVNHCKRAITLDMSHPRGLELFWEMVPKFDVIAENFSPHVMSSWGITLETLREKRPDVIFASLSGYGHQGPLAENPANGATTEPMSGLSSIHGYDDGQPMNTGGLYPDPVTGYYFAAAILTALVHRQHTGEGQRIDEAMMEGVAVQIGDAILDYGINGRIQAPQGNRHPAVAPHNYYRTADEGWVAIAAETDAQWRGVAACMGIADERYESMSGRKAHEPDLDKEISAWCQQRAAEDIDRELAATGACVAVLAGYLDAYRHPVEQFRHRSYMQMVEHPETGKHFMPTMPWTMTHTPAEKISPAPCFGQHSREVLAEELGISDDEYLDLERRGITGTTRL